MSFSNMVSPTNLSWIVLENCVCPRADAVCIRPEEYTKPVICLNRAHLGGFADHLLAIPCNYGNNTANLTDVVEQLNNANIAKATGCVNNMVFIFFLFVFMTQVCIFWAMYLNIPARGIPLPSRRRRRPVVLHEEIGRPLEVISSPRMVSDFAQLIFNPVNNHFSALTGRRIEYAPRRSGLDFTNSLQGQRCDGQSAPISKQTLRCMRKMK
ncbi:hypothetical protein niasHS_001199 [Heterodera schachtii]|uniref:Uncharacterized protein n=1 Tax=Heterodera schachtii TaxID=97005 RepID=A0ABD2KNQ8_HETSC